MGRAFNLASLLNSSGLVNLPTKVTGALPDANAPSGSVIQVVQASVTTQTIFSSTSYTDATNFNATITPSNSNNKILVVMNVNVFCDNFNAGDTQIGGKIVRNSTDISEFLMGAGYGINITWAHPVIYLDSPSSTSALTYKLQIRASSSYNTSRINRTSGPYAPISTITLMEIAA